MNNKEQTSMFLEEEEMFYVNEDEKKEEVKNKQAKSDREGRLLRLCRHNESIVLYKPPRKILKQLVELNRLVNKSMNALLNRKISMEDVRLFRFQMKELAEKGWAKLGEVYPFALENRIEDWRVFNENYEHKVALVKQNLNTAIYIAVPNCDEVGMLFMIVKHMCILRKNLKWNINLKIVETLADLADMLVNEAQKIRSEIEKKI